MSPKFQSTHSLRSATTQAASLARSPKSFNPRTPCGVRQINAYGHKSILRFQSTHSLRSATIGSRRKTATDKVSIHALLAECDRSIVSANRTRDSFNPRTPCGVRQLKPLQKGNKTMFQSTHSLRSATHILKGGGNVPYVSIHALLAECDSPEIIIRGKRQGFNPRTPCGVRPTIPIGIVIEGLFQSTHSLRSATPDKRLGDVDCLVSIHALLAECDSYRRASNHDGDCFNPRTPCGVRQAPAPRDRENKMFQSTHSLRSATVQWG